MANTNINNYIEVLSYVRANLSAHTDRFICRLLNELDSRHSGCSDGMKNAARVIHNDIYRAMGKQGGNSIESWLKSQGFDPFDVSKEERYQYRLRWIAAMAEHYKDKPNPRRCPKLLG